MVAGNLRPDSRRAASITADTPEPSSLAPGASILASITLLAMVSMWAEMTTTRSGSVVPRWMASTSAMTVGWENRWPVKVCSGVSIWRQPAQLLDSASNWAAIQRRAAPTPRVSEVVSEALWRVPKATNRVSVACSRSAETSAASAFSNGCSASGCDRAGAAANSDAPKIRIIRFNDQPPAFGRRST